MVSLLAMRASNARLAAALPPGLVAVFAGATNGIGETSMKQFARHTRKPRVYFIGRSQEAGDRIAAECKALNAEGKFVFIKADVSLIRTVDDVCRDIKSKEETINLLFLTQGTLMPGIETSEGLHYAAALPVHSRTRFIVNLLPLLERATDLRRVVSVFTATKEGAINMTDFQGWKLPLMQQRSHASSIVTLSLESLAKKAPTVSFIHHFPGPVKTGIARGTTGPVFAVLKAVSAVIGPFIYIPIVETGERHLFVATSARYPPGTVADKDAAAGVALEDGVAVARGTNGQVGSGVYSTDAMGESADEKVVQLLAGLRTDGLVEKVWDQIEGEFKRITGSVAI
ncbi:MAG: hypothetical protein M1838_001325 [Thelocarpon superellum]|nr:MAG: hypothetical protein M1838_001325 [Thelocarpon superellum]